MADPYGARLGRAAAQTWTLLHLMAWRSPSYPRCAAVDAGQALAADPKCLNLTDVEATSPAGLAACPEGVTPHPCSCGLVVGELPSSRLVPGGLFRVAWHTQSAAAVRVVRVKPLRFELSTAYRVVVCYCARRGTAKNTDRIPVQDDRSETLVSDRVVSTLGASTSRSIRLAAMHLAACRGSGVDVRASRNRADAHHLIYPICIHVEQERRPTR